MVNRYSLADHTVKITLPENLRVGGVDLGGRVLTSGGPGQNGQDGSFTGSITVRRANPTWNTEGDPTGSWVHNKTLNRTGSVELSLRQVSDDIIRLQMLASIFESDQNGTRGCLIEVYSTDKTVAKAEDCYITQVPDQVFGESAENQSWTWTSGRVTFPQTTDWPKERV